MAVVDLGTEISRDVRQLIEKNILTNGEPFSSGGILNTSCLPVLGVGSTVTSSLFAGNIFMATANPATLMAIKGGVGSAVIGANGAIVAQAPFIAASSAIMPVVAPVMFFMVVSSMMMSHRFNRIESSLDGLSDMIREMLRREVLGDYGEVLSATERLVDISQEFDESRRFTDEMKIRTALCERDLSVMKHKYKILVSSFQSESKTAISLSATDQHLFALSSVASIFVDRQRLRIALQDNPDDLARRVNSLNDKIDETCASFSGLLEHNPLIEYKDNLEKSIDEMSWWQRNISKRKTMKGLKVKKAHAEGVKSDQILEEIQNWTDMLSDLSAEELVPSVVYYRSDDGKGDLRAYYTSDLSLEAR